MSSSAPSIPSSSTLIPLETMREEEKEIHLGFMREALAMAELALRTNETPVGCVFVHNNTVIGRGMNATNRTYNGTRHAEFVAVSSILSQSSPSSTREGGSERSGSEEKKFNPEVLRECDLYVTVEPCIMCASFLRQMGIRKVYYGASNEKFGGTGGVLDIHHSNGKVSREDMDGKDAKVSGEKEEGDYEVSGGWLRDEAVHMLQRFYMQENERAPEPKARGKKGVVVEVEAVVEGVVKGEELGGG